MKPLRFSSAFLLALAATASGAAEAATHGHEADGPPPAVARSEAQARNIEAALRQGRLTGAQAEALRTARASQERRARELAAMPRDTDAALALSHQQDRLDWAIRTGNTGFIQARRI